MAFLLNYSILVDSCAWRSYYPALLQVTSK